jgi:hypothetical protein
MLSRTYALSIVLTLTAVPIPSARSVAAVDPARRCEATKLRAASAEVAATLACYAKASLRSKAVDPRCLSKAAEKFSSVFRRAKGGGCRSVGKAAPVEDAANQAVDAIVAASATATTTTTRASTTTTPYPSGSRVCCDGRTMFIRSCFEHPGEDVTSYCGGSGLYVAPLGQVCDGGTGRCAPARTGVSFCCQTEFQGQFFCSEGPAVPEHACATGMSLEGQICRSDGHCALP